MVVTGTGGIHSTAEALPENAGEALPGTPAAEEGGLLQSFAGLTEALLDRAGGLVRIIALEGRLAGLSLAYMLLLAVIGAVLMVSAWLLFNAGLAIWLAGKGWAVLGVVLSLGVANLIAAGVAMMALKKISNNLLFSGSRHELFTRHPDGAANA
ncbi:MAG TPA: hypothetical protein VFX02_12480 [Gammaproteobacteria bacterium]|nr:hypothetical protein [Gammaproteobacteria bacterium]